MFVSPCPYLHKTQTYVPGAAFHSQVAGKASTYSWSSWRPPMSMKAIRSPRFSFTVQHIHQFNSGHSGLAPRGQIGTSLCAIAAPCKIPSVSVNNPNDSAIDRTALVVVNHVPALLLRTDANICLGKSCRIVPRDSEVSAS